MAYNPTVWKDNDVISAEKLNKLENALAEISKNGGGSTVPAGMISIWSGLATNIPDGWILCDGTNGTPDLRDKFVLGAGTSHTVGETGGEEEVTLTTDQMPSHSHTITPNYTSSVSTGTGNCLVKSASSGALQITTSSKGSSKAHNNMPPYYTLCYVMKI